MNYIKHLSGFFELVASDERLNPTHVSLYIAVFQQWNLSRFVNPISISRENLMRISKISSFATYHKCIKDLHRFGYFKYCPSFNPVKGSVIYLSEFQSGATLKAVKQPVTNPDTRDTSAEQVYKKGKTVINNKNELNSHETTKHQRTADQKLSGKEIGIHQETLPGSRQIRIEKEVINSNSSSKQHEIVPPDQKMVHEFFALRSAPEREAERFYNHYESNGWRVGGKTPMKNWHAAALNWISNAHRYQGLNAQTPRPGVLFTLGSKNYSEPL